MPNYLQDHDFCDILAISSSSAMLKCLSDNNWSMTHPGIELLSNGMIILIRSRDFLLCTKKETNCVLFIR